LTEEGTGIQISIFVSRLLDFVFIWLGQI